MLCAGFLFLECAVNEEERRQQEIQRQQEEAQRLQQENVARAVAERARLEEDERLRMCLLPHLVQIMSKSSPAHAQIMSKPFPDHVDIISRSYGHYIDIISISYQYRSYLDTQGQLGVGLCAFREGSSAQTSLFSSRPWLKQVLGDPNEI